MFDLICKKTNCVYNKNCNCTSKEVDVKKDTSCKTFKPSNEKEVGEVEKIDQPAFRKNIEVQCNAACIFNNNCECIANGITVEPCNKENCPNCSTFLPK